MAYAAYLHTLTVPITFIFNTFIKTSVESTYFGVAIKPILYLKVLPGIATPAQFTASVTFPKVLTVNSISSFTLSSLVTSVLKNLTF